MKITQKADELIISIPKGILEINEIQEFLDYLRYRVLVSRSKATDEQINALSKEINMALGKRNASVSED